MTSDDGRSFTRRRLERMGYTPPPVTPLEARWLRRAPFEWVWQVPVRVVGFETMGETVDGVFATRLRVGNEDQLAMPGPAPLELLIKYDDAPGLVLPSQRPGIMISLELFGEKLHGANFAIRPVGVVAGELEPGKPTP